MFAEGDGHRRWHQGRRERQRVLERRRGPRHHPHDVAGGQIARLDQPADLRRRAEEADLRHERSHSAATTARRCSSPLATPCTDPMKTTGLLPGPKRKLNRRRHSDDRRRAVSTAHPRIGFIGLGVMGLPDGTPPRTGPDTRSLSTTSTRIAGPPAREGAQRSPWWHAACGGRGVGHRHHDAALGHRSARDSARAEGPDARLPAGRAAARHLVIGAGVHQGDRGGACAGGRRHGRRAGVRRRSRRHRRGAGLHGGRERMPPSPA